MTVDRRAGAVYPVREDSELLLPFAQGTLGLTVLEVGCGQGAASLVAARAGARVAATDLNPYALRALKDAARAEGVEVEVIRTDLAAGLRRFDRILANPPYLPTSSAARDPDRWVNLALDGGEDGLSVTTRLFAQIPDHLTPDGRAYVVASSRQSELGIARLEVELRRRGGSVREVSHRALGTERLFVLEITLGRR